MTYTLFEPDAIRGLPVRFIGFAADEPEIPGAYRLTRFTMACCAADAYPIQIIITGTTPRPANDQWLQVDGIWDGAMFDLDEYTQIPILEAAAQQVIEAPAQPYEY